MTMGERIKKIRKDKSLTQQALAKKMGTTQNSIARYETDKVTPSSAVISLICREFHVNETWLRTGEGEMFTQQEEDLLLDDPSLDDADRALLASYIEAPPGLRQQIKEFLFQTVQRMKDAQFESETALLHRQLDKEREAEKKGASESSAGSSDTDAIASEN